MNNNSPLLSICIPTYNRASYLEATLESITSQPVFQNTREVEIAISDNCSTDGTPAVISAFQKKYPEKISACRQESPIDAHSNFAKAMEAGRGLLRKLHNDTLRLNNNDFLEDCLNLIREYQTTKPLIFFLNGRHFQRRPGRLSFCHDLDAFINHVSFYSTWIGGFSLWAEDVPVYAPVFHAASNEGRDFAHSKILFLAISGGRKALVYNPEFALVAYDAPKAVTKEHLKTIYFAEYVPLLRECAAQGHISTRAKRREISRFSLLFYVSYYYRLSGQKFSHDFRRDSSFLKDYVPAYFYYFICAYYLLFCFFYKTLIPHKKLIKNFF